MHTCSGFPHWQCSASVGDPDCHQTEQCNILALGFKVIIRRVTGFLLGTGADVGSVEKNYPTLKGRVCLRVVRRDSEEEDNPEAGEFALSLSLSWFVYCERVHGSRSGSKSLEEH
jgi:hypothetical protein